MFEWPSQGSQMWSKPSWIPQTSGGWAGMHQKDKACEASCKITSLSRQRRGCSESPMGEGGGGAAPDPEHRAPISPDPSASSQSLQPPSSSCVHCGLLGPVPPHLLPFVMLKNSSAGYSPILSLIPPKPSSAGRAPLL